MVEVEEQDHNLEVEEDEEDNKMERYCLKHKMSDGTIMDGPIHGPGQICVEWGDKQYKKGGTVKNPNYKGRPGGRRTAKDYSAGGKMARKKKFSPGGMLVGPSHDNGGIQALVDGTEPIEVEGGEFIINKQTVDAVGEEFLHKLNSTETTHHTGGFNEGQLPSPSKFKDGGRVRKKVTKMANGGTTQNIYRKSSQIKPNPINKQNGTINKICRNLSGDESSCKRNPMCNYNYSTGMCH